jgi:cytochrome c
MFNDAAGRNGTMRARYLIPAVFGVLLAACDGSPTTPGGNAPAAPSIPAPSLAELPAPWNAADLRNGSSVFAKCRACHSVIAREGNKVGPNLHGVFDRHPATAPKFNYSGALKNFAEERWTPELIDHWLQKPKDFLPGNGMFFDGIASEDDRRDLIAWLLIETRK